MEPDANFGGGLRARGLGTRLLAAPLGSLLALLILLNGCAVQLAPQYDEFIDKNLAALNQSIASFVAGVPVAGYPKSSFSDHEKYYADPLGKIQALKARAAARPVAQPLIAKWLGLGEKAEDVIGIGEKIPSVESLRIVAERLSKMREIHQGGKDGGSSGLSAAFAQRMGEQIQIAMNNAITYELALKR